MILLAHLTAQRAQAAGPRDERDLLAALDAMKARLQESACEGKEQTIKRITWVMKRPLSWESAPPQQRATWLGEALLGPSAFAWAAGRCNLTAAEADAVLSPKSEKALYAAAGIPQGATFWDAVDTETTTGTASTDTLCSCFGETFPPLPPNPAYGTMPIFQRWPLSMRLWSSARDPIHYGCPRSCSQPLVQRDNQPIGYAAVQILSGMTYTQPYLQDLNGCFKDGYHAVRFEFWGQWSAPDAWEGDQAFVSCVSSSLAALPKDKPWVGAYAGGIPGTWTVELFLWVQEARWGDTDSDL